MKYAIIKTGGKQYKVEEKAEILVDKLEQEKGKEFEFKEVLLYRTDDEIIIGQPFIDKVKVKAVLIEHLKGKKITVSKFKAKVRYRRKIGFRPLLSRVKIKEISKIQKKKKKT